MRAAWFGLLCLVLYAHPSHAVSMAQCPDGSGWYPTAQGVSFCPSKVTVSGTSPGTTTATITGSVTVASGTITASIRLSCTPLQWRDVTNGLGDEATGSDSTITSGDYSISITGLAEGTTYCAHLVQYDATGKPSIAVRTEFTTGESGGGAPAAGAAITGGDDYYAGTGGSDANSGLTHALRWANYPTTDTSSLAASTDLWLLEGSVWTNRPMTLARAGSSGDYAETGCYYDDAGTTRRCRDTDKGMTTTDTKPEIKGGLTTTCLNAGTCTYPTTPPAGDGLASMWSAMVTVAATADYSRVENLHINLARYACFNAAGTGRTNVGSLHHVYLYGIDCQNTGFGNIQITDGAQDIVVDYSNIYDGNTCEVLKLRRTSSDTTACNSAGWPSGIVAARVQQGRILMQNNAVIRNFGEGFGCAFYAEYCIMRNNISAALWSDAITVDSGRYIVAENNILIGKQGVVSSYWSGGDTSEGISGVMLNGAETSTPYDATGSVYRNNLVVAANACFYMRTFPGVTRDVGNKVYGNTCITDLSTGTYPSTMIYNTEVATADMVELNFQNNVVWAPNRNAAGMCDVSTDAQNTFVDNHWSFNPSDSDCDGTGDTYGDPGLTLSSITDWNAFDYDTWPTYANANPAGGSAVLGTGTALTSAILDKDNYGYAYTSITEVVAGTLTEAKWECALCVDAEGTTRASPPSKGAVE